MQESFLFIKPILDCLRPLNTQNDKNTEKSII